MNLGKLTHDVLPGNHSEKNPKAIANGIPAIALTTGIYDFYLENPFTKAHHHAVLTGQMLAIMMDKVNLFNNNTTSFLGFSLGSVITYNTLLTLFDLGCLNKVGDVCLMGACVDSDSFLENAYKLIGSKGVVQGKLTVVYTSNDSVLQYLFKTARFGESPLGLERINKERLSAALRRADAALAQLSEADLEEYLHTKLDNWDVSRDVSSHTDYKYKYNLILPRMELNNDLKHYL